MTIITYILCTILVMLCISLLITLNSRSRTIQQLNEQQNALQDKLHALIAERADALARVEALKAKSESDKAELDKLQSSFRIEFQNLANDILEQKSRQFKEDNKESLETLLKPFKINISEFRERVEKIYSEENQQRGALKNEIKNLLDLNKSITEQTTNLTNALKGNSKVQGDWGEMILETILESSNLINGIHYTTQTSLKDEAGNTMRPDVILNLPDNKQIVIDSKVSLTAFVDLTACDQASQQDIYLKNHLVSVRKHVDELGSKRYQNLVNSPDFVIMFIPNEPAFMAALQNDSSIWVDAYNKKVIISSPTNLFALLKIVDDFWKRDSQSKNAIAIANEGANLYDKFVTFVDTLTDIGKNIDSATKNYEKAMNQLKTGKGNLVTRSEKLKEMGVKATKSLPVQITDSAEE